MFMLNVWIVGIFVAWQAEIVLIGLDSMIGMVQGEKVACMNVRDM
jgi:hypothetical protein